MSKPLHRLDLNLLITMQVLLQERSVTKTAKKLNVTPSAVSKALGKLRDWFGDPLFIREPHGLQPTPLSLSMEEELAEWFQLGSQLSAKKGTATPRGVDFQLMMEAPLHMLVLGSLTQLISGQYPDSTIRILDWDYDSLEAIINGEADIGFCGRETHHRSQETLALLPYYIDYEVLFEDQPMVFIRDDHPVLQQEWDLDAFLAYSHINIIWEARERWALDEVLSGLGKERQIALSVSNFDQSLFMAAQPGHEMFTTAPGYCQSFATQRYPNLVALPIPISEQAYEELSIPFTLMWHKRNAYNPKIAWLRSVIKELVTSNK